MLKPIFNSSPIPFELEPMSAVDEQRRYVRHRARGKATLYRNGDRMRFGMTADIWDIAVEGMSLIASTPLAIGEMVQFTVHNDIQRYARELRGVVRWCDPWEADKFRIGIELFVRLPGGEISLLKGNGLSQSNSQWL